MCCNKYCKISNYFNKYCKILKVLQNLKFITILIVKSLKYCNTLQYYWNYPCIRTSLSVRYIWLINSFRIRLRTIQFYLLLFSLDINNSTAIYSTGEEKKSHSTELHSTLHFAHLLWLLGSPFVSTSNHITIINM